MSIDPYNKVDKQIINNPRIFSNYHYGGADAFNTNSKIEEILQPKALLQDRISVHKMRHTLL